MRKATPQKKKLMHSPKGTTRSPTDRHSKKVPVHHCTGTRIPTKICNVNKIT